MREWSGNPGAPGQAEGLVFVLERRSEALRGEPLDMEEELARLTAGRARYVAQLQALAGRGGADGDAVLEAYLAIAGDDVFFEEAAALVRERGLSAEDAVEEKRAAVEAIFMALKSDFARQRAEDVNNVCREITEALVAGGGEALLPEKGEYIVFARDLSPIQTLRMDPARLRGFVTGQGGLTSHTVILARSMGIPAVVGAGPLPEGVENGALALLDGDEGRVVVSPDEETLLAFRSRGELRKKQTALYAQAARRPARTLDGREVGVWANTGDAHTAAALDFECCGGVGLYRTEFWYMDAGAYPDEEAQFVAYRDIARRAAGRKDGSAPVVIRTLDIGADKQAEYMHFAREENPALGLRGIRRSLVEPEVFITQLRAILRAGAEGDVRVMFPMVTEPGELEAAREMLRHAAAELSQEGVPHRADMPVGIMVETPSAALLADKLATLCDFFSVGTNDLTQYITAADRMNERVQELDDVCNVSVLRAVAGVCRAAASAGIPVGICGEAAAEPRLVPLWVAMGMEELSVAPALIGRTKYLVGQVDAARAQAVLGEVLALGTATEVKARLDEWKGI